MNSERQKVAHEIMVLIKRNRPWTQFSRRICGDEEEWIGTDGLVKWEIFSTDYGLAVQIYGHDQMCYSWGELDGTPEMIVANCLSAREVDVKGGEQWTFLGLDEAD